jgi:PiT family inorganic phosphate transporter
MTWLAPVAVGLMLAFANGANDNFKGVATLFGGGTASYRTALGWATVTTLAGSAAALVLAGGLLAAFSGKGLVPPGVVADPRFPAAVALAAGATVLLATRLGFPVSTTHALIGALVGAGLVASPAGVDPAALGGGFVLPLLTSPFVALVLALLLYPPLSGLRRRLGVEPETCICVGREVVAVLPPGADPAAALRAAAVPSVGMGTEATCRVRYRGRLLGVRAETAADAAHFASAGVVSFARGLNDTPKIAALLLAGGALGPDGAIPAVAAGIALGGVLGARRVAETMAHRVTAMNPGQGLVANLVTGLLVVGASRLGMPVSTTHVSCGALFGIGTATRRARWGMIARILLAWGVTLPLGAALGAAGFAGLAR